jgi:hypothetical protein
MYVFTAVAASSLIGTTLSVIALLFVYFVTLVPRNSMQNYGATPEECASNMSSSLPVPVQHMMPVVIQVPQR